MTCTAVREETCANLLSYCRFSKKYTDARFYKFDVDAVPDLAHELSIRAMPTFTIFKDGELHKTVVGANPKVLEAAIADAAPAAKAEEAEKAKA
jgi:thioredoxin-like negative regulator of GroEL